MQGSLLYECVLLFIFLFVFIVATAAKSLVCMREGRSPLKESLHLPERENKTLNTDAWE